MKREGSPPPFMASTSLGTAAAVVHEDSFVNDPFSEPGQWWLVYTKPRNEKALAAELDKRGVTCFLPLIHVRRWYCGRSVDVQKVLFPSYLFFSGGDDERIITLKTNRVVQVINVADQTRLRDELRNVSLACSGTEPVALYPGLKVGQRCRVVSGSLRGMEGVILQRRSICRVYVGVDVLGQSAQLEIDPSLLEVIE